VRHDNTSTDRRESRSGTLAAGSGGERGEIERHDINHKWGLIRQYGHSECPQAKERIRDSEAEELSQFWLERE
jgi:hypothetical protein